VASSVCKRTGWQASGKEWEHAWLSVCMFLCSLICLCVYLSICLSIFPHSCLYFQLLSAHLIWLGLVALLFKSISFLTCKHLKIILCYSSGGGDECCKTAKSFVIFNLFWFHPRDLVRFIKISSGWNGGAKSFHQSPSFNNDIHPIQGTLPEG